MNSTSAKRDIEWWLHRYQGLLGALIGAGIAIYLIQPAIRQADLTDRQVAAAFKPVVEERIALVAGELRAISEIRNRLNTFVPGFESRMEMLKVNNLPPGLGEYEALRWAEQMSDPILKARDWLQADTETNTLRDAAIAAHAAFSAHAKDITKRRVDEARRVPPPGIPADLTAEERQTLLRLKTTLLGAMDALEPKLRQRQAEFNKSLDRIVSRVLETF